MATKTFTTSGTWEVPALVTSVTFEAWGGGGGAGGSTDSTKNGGGGGGGSYAIKDNSVTAGNTLTITVAAAVNGGINETTDGNAGGTSSSNLGGTTYVSAAGGGKGISWSNGGQGGAGGTATVYTTRYAGGAGSSCVADGNCQGGGGGAGSSGAGGNASGITGGIKGSGDGAGAGGNGNNSGTGNNGTAAGGGGGSGGLPENLGVGGNGAAGQVRLTWTVGAPAAPTNVAATDGSYTDKVVVTWTKSTGATGYKVYEGSNLLATLGDVATYDDSAAAAGSITSGATVATDGTYSDKVALSLSGTSTSNGASRTYKVRAVGDGGDSGDSSTDTGYRGVGALGYQWQRSAADSDASYSNLDGATSSTYNDTTAPSNGDGRYYKCTLTATGASNTPTASTANRGYRKTYKSQCIFISD
jgi:hypothetical protein